MNKFQPTLLGLLNISWSFFQVFINTAKKDGEQISINSTWSTKYWRDAFSMHLLIPLKKMETSGEYKFHSTLHLD